jgi:5'-3' exonuclease
MPDWLFVDGSSLIFRAFFGVPQAVRAPDGRSVNAVRGFLDTMARVLPARRPYRLAVASDEDWRPAWRVELLPSYKAHRVAEPIPPDLDRQMPHIHRVLAAIGVDFVGAPDFEAEDVIASWVTQVDGTAEILSGDRDLFGLIDGTRVRVLYPEKGGLAEVDDAEVERRYGIPGRRYPDFAVLRGDPSDGLPGLAGVGAKRAADLVRRHGGIEGILGARPLSTADADYLKRALRVVMPAAGDIPLPEGRRPAYPADPEDLAAATEELGLGSSPGRLVDALKGLPVPSQP